MARDDSDDEPDLEYSRSVKPDPAPPSSRISSSSPCSSIDTETERRQLMHNEMAHSSHAAEFSARVIVDWRLEVALELSGEEPTPRGDTEDGPEEQELVDQMMEGGIRQLWIAALVVLIVLRLVRRS